MCVLLYSFLKKKKNFLTALGLGCCVQLSLVVASRGYSWLWCLGFPFWWLLLLRSAGSRYIDLSSCCSRALEQGIVVVAHRLGCSTVCGIFPGYRSNPCPLHWQLDSHPLYYISFLIFQCAYL